MGDESVRAGLCDQEGESEWVEASCLEFEELLIERLWNCFVRPRKVRESFEERPYNRYQTPVDKGYYIIDSRIDDITYYSNEKNSIRLDLIIHR